MFRIISCLHIFVSAAHSDATSWPSLSDEGLQTGPDVWPRKTYLRIREPFLSTQVKIISKFDIVCFLFKKKIFKKNLAKGVQLQFKKYNVSL